MNQKIKRIAIVRLSALGDIVNSAVVLQFLHKRFPLAKIEWVTEEVFAPLLENHPLLSAIHTINLKKIKKEKSFSLLKETISNLRSLGRFDIVIDMQGLLKSAVVARIISKRTHGFDKSSTRESLASLFYKTTSNIAYDENIVKRNSFVVADALGFNIDKNMLLNKNKIFQNVEIFQHIKNDKNNVAVVIGASWPSKKYPKEKILELCDELKQNSLIIWGNEAEKDEAMWICKNSKWATLAPKLSLVELVSFIDSCDLLIGNDTGPTHIAWAQNIPSIILFGPTTKRMFYETPKNIGIESASSVDLYKIDKNDFSIKDIKVEEILRYAKELLKYGI